MMRIANKEATKSRFYFRLGAVIVKGNRVLSTGHNRIGYCELNDFKCSKHAEMDAILKLLRKEDGLSSLSGSAIYVSRINHKGETLLAKPCKKCRKLIESVGIKRIVFTTNDKNTETIKC
jgi:deoxycytidylate deaminase